MNNINKNKFRYYFMEDGEEQADPNAQQEGQAPQEADPNAQQEGQAPQQPVGILPEEEQTDEDDVLEKEFPMEKDGGNAEQDVINFTNFQKLQYFNKFKELSLFILSVENTLNKAKTFVSFDKIDDEEQHKIINLLIESLEQTKQQVNFFLEKGIVSVNIDKTRCIFRSEIRKLNLIIDKFEELMRNVNNKK